MLPNLDFLHIENDTITYGNYGGLDYSAGEFGGRITGTSADPAPVDAFDQLFYQHDLATQNANGPADLVVADVTVVEGVLDLLNHTTSQDVHDWLLA